MDLLRWISFPPDVTKGMYGDWWPWATLALSAAVAVGYGVIAFNWYFHAKVARSPESRAATARLLTIVVCCAACGYAFHLADMGWGAWRVYDAALLLLACHTWSFALRMRGGLRLVNERLAEVDELERSAKKYREIAELLPQGVWTATADGRVDFSNRAWLEFAGPGRTWLDAVHPDEHPDVLLWWRTAVVGRMPVSREIRLAGQGGSYRAFVVRATPVAQGELMKWLGVCADVEDQKRLAAEKELAARQKTFFLNALSHDLRAPLHNVVLNAHLLKMTAREQSELENVEMIVENAVAAGDLVSRLLDFAKGGEDRNAPERVSLAAMLQQVARRFQPVAEGKGLNLRLDAQQDAEVWVDRQKLERIVSNLVDNAIKFTDVGGICLELGAARCNGDEDGGACVRISDSGIGIPDASVPYLFDEFYQVNNHERDRNKGFGIGLAICRSLARQLGGDVRLLRTGPHGSCFEVDVSGLACVGRGGRPNGPAGDRLHLAEAGLCRV